MTVMNEETQKLEKVSVRNDLEAPSQYLKSDITFPEMLTMNWRPFAMQYRLKHKIAELNSKWDIVRRDCWGSPIISRTAQDVS